MSRAYYRSFVNDFLTSNEDEIVGKLNKAGTQYASQWTITTKSWDSSIHILKKALAEIVKENKNAANWGLLLEYEIPRLQSRIDVVLLANELIFVIEFKFDRKKYELADIRQVEDYALDLNDFHFESRNKTIIPVLLAPLAKTFTNNQHDRILSNVKGCLKTNEQSLATILLESYDAFHDPNKSASDIDAWEQSKYAPTPTIIQAATSLFAGQSVEAISIKGADNLDSTSKYLISAINNARRENKKIVCFVTGVPGAGKTLVGLNIVHERESFNGTDSNTAYFSGNVPLVNVLREALARDDYKRQISLYKRNLIEGRPTKGDSERKVKAKIQNLHQFIKDSINSKRAPNERIVVFDEAQRCWDARQFSNKAKQNRNIEANTFEIEEKSEAELLFEFMNRHDGWAVIIALVGGGQEINTGEGGIAEWGKSLENKFNDWEIHISPQLIEGDDSTSGQRLFSLIRPEGLNIITNEKLHLKVSQRSFRAANLNEWVNAVLDNNEVEASKISKTFQNDYPLHITRDIELAKNWLRKKRRGTKRIGVIASSGGLRLRPYGVQVRELIDEALWFLNDEDDIRSSQYLEVTATEYKVQGLELNWVAVCWDADLRRDAIGWDYKCFSGTTWQNINGTAEKQFLLNTYRVLLTRAREGIIVFVPEGDLSDYTRLPDFYNGIYNYLISCGLQPL
jgi:Uncharacterized conserved protein (DUF2075)